eukprot:GHVT01088391.1.p1 GENE.GHVT01088391.1~~GHVT01088391.1.p1  ORF type:complete len:349 (-),score=104.40 GHVT01088391.1:640-1686(-)
MTDKDAAAANAVDEGAGPSLGGDPKSVVKTESAEAATVDSITNQLRDVAIDGSVVDPTANLTETQKATVEKLRELQNEYKTQLGAYTKEWNALKAKYEKGFSLLYDERKKTLVDESVAETDDKTNGTPALPSFWMQVFDNQRMLCDVVEADDRAILKYLRNIRCEVLDDAAPDSFRLLFDFAPNPFFEESTLMKQYNMRIPAGEEDAVLNSTESTKITWKPSKDVTKKRVRRTQKNKKTGQLRTVEETVAKRSFFSFFTDHEIPNETELEDMAEEEVADMELLLETDYDLGIVFRERVVPLALGYYLGEVHDESEEEDEDDDDDDDDDDEEDDSDDDSDDDGRRRRRN